MMLQGTGGNSVEQQKALLDTVGEVCTSANEAHQTFFCSVCQGPTVSFSQCKHRYSYILSEAALD